MLKLVCAILAVFSLVAAPVGGAEPVTGPTPPCNGAAAWPPYSPPDQEPTTRIWRAADLATIDWKPSNCTGWSSSSTPKLVAALAGTFRLKGSADALLARIGSVSSLVDVRYWSRTESAWRPFALDATALSSSHQESRRADFSAAELTQGSEVYYMVNDNQMGQVIYRMRILERTDERIVLASENVSAVNAFFFFTVLHPGVIQAVEFLERRGPDLWHVYVLTRIDQPPKFLFPDQEASSANRLVALFRRLAGIPTDQEPPAQP